MSEVFNNYILKFSELIKCDTVSGPNFISENKSINFENTLKLLFPSIYNKCRIKEIDGSFIIELIGRRNSAPSLILCHYDTAEINGNWTHNPLIVETDNSKIYGRGVLDAKGNLFCILQAFDELLSEGFIPSQDIYLASVYDHESKGEAINSIYNYFKNNSIYFGNILDEGGYIVNSPLDGVNKDYAFVGLGEKAYATLKFTIKGNGGHASHYIKDAPLFNLLTFIGEFEFNDVFKKSIHVSIHDIFNQLSQDMEGFDKVVYSHSKLFSPIIKSSLKKQPHALSLIQSCLSFTSMHLSDSNKTVTSEAYAIGNLSIGLNDTLEDCLERIKSIAKYYNVEVEVIKNEDVSRVTSSKSYQYIKFEEAIKECFKDVTIIPYVSNTKTDLRVMDKLCSNSFRFVPFKVTRDQLSRIHGTDENIDIDCLEKAVSFYKKLIKNS